MNRSTDVRNLTLEETVRLVGWAAQEGWNPSPDDAGAFFAADPEGFLGCLVDGELGSGISAVSYGENFGFIGLYITRPEFRGRGYGLQVWNAGMKRLAGKTIGLDGVPAQQANYERMGFRPAYGSTRWSGRLPIDTSPSAARTAIWQDTEAIAPFDRRFFPSDRMKFLRNWLRESRAALIAVRDGNVAGYAVIRQCLEGYKIGPLFALEAHTATTLLKACGPAASGAIVHLDVPNAQREFTNILEGLGFQSGFETARMYFGVPPRVDMSGVFAVTTLELG